MKAIGIILAAGESARMGLPKALLDAGSGRTFVERLAATFTAAGCSPMVVVGAHAAQIEAAHPSLKTVLNAGWREGQLSSVRAGLRAALAQGAQRVLIHPVDAPLIAVATVEAILNAVAGSPAVTPRHLNEPGHPLGLSSRGARAVLASTAATLAAAIAPLEPLVLAVDDPAIVENLNTPEAYEERFGHAPGRPGGVRRSAKG